MAYCKLEHVQAEFKGHPGFTSLTSPTEDDVKRFILETDAEINGRLAQKYSTPITGATSLLIIRSVSLGIVAERVRKIIATKTGKTEEDQKAGDDSATIARKMLESIIIGKVTLPDATLATEGVRSYTYSNNIEHSFDRDVEQW